MKSLVITYSSLSSPIPSPPHSRRLRRLNPTAPVVALRLSRQTLTTVRSSSPSPHVQQGRVSSSCGGVLEVEPIHHEEEGRSGGETPEGFGEVSPSREVEEERACAGCGAEGLVLCATCSGSGLYVDAILESQGVVVNVTCLGCGGSGNVLCPKCRGRGHL